MLKKWRVWNIWLGVGLIFFWLLTPLNAFAAGSCSAVSQPHSVTPGSSTTFQITVNNTGNSNVNWIKITRPSTNFTITAARATGWVGHRTLSNVVFDTGTLAPGAGITISVTATAANTNAAAANWLAQTSENDEGANPTSCTGDTSVAIAALPPAPTISNIGVTNITTTSATVVWNTDQASNSVVRYGKTNSYGQTASVSNSVTSHSVSLNGLTAGTNYHFQVESTNPGGTTTSGNNGFRTTTVTPGPVSTAPQSTPTTTNPAPASLQIKLDPLPKNIYAEPPIFTGSASDINGISVVEYSTDNGGNWLNASLNGPPNNPTFNFQPSNLPDGNYVVLARATNNRGQQALSSSITIIIDKIPPIIGGIQTAIGPQFLVAGPGHVLETVAGIEQKISLHAIGGATTVTIHAYHQTNLSAQHSFSLSRIPGSDLWTAATNFTLPGRYRLEAIAIDGANRQTDKSLGEIFVSNPIDLVANGSAAKNTKSTLYAWEPSMNNWIVWPADAYGQSNPQSTNNDGKLRYFLPPGRYYLEIEGGSYRRSVSNIITLTQASALTGKVNLEKTLGFGIGSVRLKLPSLLPAHFRITSTTPLPAPTFAKQTKLQDFSLKRHAGDNLVLANIAGRQTLFIYTPTWSPAAVEQLAIINSLDQKTLANTYVFSELEDIAALQSYQSVAGYKFPLWQDSNGHLTKQLNLIHSPSAVVIDKNGLVKTLVSGVLSKQDIIKLLGSQ